MASRKPRRPARSHKPRPHTPLLSFLPLEDRVVPATPLGDLTAPIYWGPDAPGGNAAVPGVRPGAAHTFTVAPGQLRAALAGVGSDPAADLKVFALPRPDGRTDRFGVYEVPIMAPELAAQFPDIKTYRGVGIDDPAARLTLDVSDAGGLRAQVLTPGGTYYIDPAVRPAATRFASYFRTDAVRQGSFNFHAVEHDHDHDPKSESAAGRGPGGAAAGRGGASGLAARTGPTLRTFRTAVAATGEYTSFHGGTAAGGLAAVVTSVNRVSGVFEQELTVRLQLVANNASLIYTNAASDPYTNGNAGAMINENQTNVDAVIGDANYDIGHVFGTNSGGLAGLGVVGRTGVKARGITGGPAPTGDPFDIDYVAHEMGHQFGGNHTFNTAVDPNRNASTAYEPGSGSTIMAYAGITPPDDLQPNSDPQFHWVSFDEITTYLGSIPAVGTSTPTLNTAPTVSAGKDYTIPAGTPFVLTATGSDPNLGDQVFYSWEQADLGKAQFLADPDNGKSPLFRSRPPTLSPSRTFPRLQELLAGTTPVGERLPTLARQMDFRVTARDNKIGGGGVNTDDMVVNVVPTGRSFRVTGPAGGAAWSAGALQNVTWDVAGTTAAPISAGRVRILLSTDGGLTFPTVLTPNTPNDGLATVAIPAGITTNAARVRVEPVGNIFFNISAGNFPISAITPAKFVVTKTNPAPGAVDPAGFTRLAVDFSQNVDPATIGVNDLSVNQGTITAATMLDADTVAYDVANVSGGPFIATLATGAVVSVTGVPVRPVVLDYFLDDGTTPFPTPLEQVGPLGWGAYQGTFVPPDGIDSATDDDLYSISLEAASRFSVVVTPTDPTLRPVVELVDKTGTAVASFTSPAPGKEAILNAVPIGPAGRYVIRVVGAGGTTGLYTVRAVVGAAVEVESAGGGPNGAVGQAESLVAAFTPLPGGASAATVVGRADANGLLSDEVEDNGALLSANDASNNFAPLTKSTVYQLGLTGTLGTFGDADWFDIGFLDAGDIITVTQSGAPGASGTLGDPLVELWRAGSPTAPAAADDDGGPGPGFADDSMINRFTIQVPDRYFVRAGSFGNFFTGTYRLGVMLDNTGAAPATGGGVTAEAEPNDSMLAPNNASSSWRQANALSQTNGTITANDRDVFRFTFAAGDRVTVRAAGTNGLAPVLSLLDAAGNPLGTDDGTTVAGLNSGLYGFVIATAGTYYVDVQGGGVGTGDYRADVFLSTPATVTAGAPEPDLYAVDLVAGTPVTFGIGRDGGGAGRATLRVLDSAGRPLASGTTGATNFARGLAGFIAPATGIYLVEVADSSPAEYALTVVKGGILDREPNDNAGAAQGLGGAPVAVGAIEDGNSDWYVVTVPTAGGVIVAETATPGDGPGEPGNALDPRVEVYAPDGTLIRSDDNGGPDGRNASARVTGPQAGLYRVRVTAPPGAFGEYVLTAKVVANRSPVGVTGGGPYAIDEGQSLTLVAAAGDPDNDALTFTWDINGDGVFGDATGANPTLTWAQLNAVGVTGGPATFNVQVRASDGYSAPSPSAPTTLTVANLAPTAGFVADGATVEGKTATVRFTNPTDPSPAATGAGLRFSYDFDNDGTWDFGDGTYAGSVTAAAAVVPAAVLGDGPSRRPVRGLVIDSSGGSTVYTTRVDVGNAPPTAALTDTGPVDVGSAVTVTFANPSDPSPADAAAGFRFSFDFNNDGDFTDAGDVANSATPSAAFAFPSPGDYTVRGRITDRDGGSADLFRVVTVRTVAPAAVFSADAQVNEGGAATVRFTNPTHPSQAAAAAGFRYAYDFDGDGAFEVGGPTYDTATTATTAAVPADVLANGPASRVVRGRVLEVNGGFTDYTAAISVVNVAPTAALTAGAPTPLGTPAAVRFVGASDAAPDVAAGLLYSFDFDNDGDFTSTGDVAGSSSPTAGFAFADPGTYTVRGRVADRDGGFTDATAKVTVTNVAPTAEFSVFAPGGGAVVTEGDDVTLRMLNGDHPSPAVSAAGLRYSYDFDNDGDFDLGDGTFAGSVGAVTASLPEQLIDGPSTRTARARVLEAGGLFTDYTATFQVLNAAPTATLTGPGGRIPATVPFTAQLGGATDSAADAAAGLRFSFDFNNDGDFTDAGEVANGTAAAVQYAYPAPGFYTLRGRVTDRDGGFTDYTLPVQVDVPPGQPAQLGERWTAVGSGVGSPPQVRLFDRAGTERFSGLAFEPAFTGGVRVATGDFTGDGIPDLVAGTGPGRATEVRVLDGRDGREVFSFQPFESSFTGGVYVAAGDVNKDGVADLAVSPDEGGGPRVRVLSGDGFGQITDFFGIRDVNFRGGARAAFGDVNGDGTDDLLVAAGFGGGPRVAVWNGATVAAGNPQVLFNDFFVFEQTLRNGVFIASGDLDGDGFAEVIAGGGPGGGPRVFALSGKGLLEGRQEQRANFFAGDPASRGGVRITAADFDADNRDDILTGAGTGAGSRVVGYRGADIGSDGQPNSARDLEAFGGFSGGVFVG